MTQPAILGLGTAIPGHRYDQIEISTSLAPAFDSHRAPAIFRATEIKARHCVVDDLE